MDFLPRLAIRSMLPDGDERRVIIHHPLNEWQTASLRLFLLGLQIDSLDLYLNQSEWTRYPDCFAPMPVRQKAVAIWDLVLHHTRHLLPPPNGPKRLFIMRLDSPKRVARNQEEVAAALEKLGFTCLDPGKLSFEEEIALMGNVEIVVGAFGAALTNILFAPPGSSVVEIRGTIRQPFYRHLAFWRGMRHTDIAYTEVPGTHPEMIDQDYMIPLDTLLQRLSDLGIR